MNAEQKEGLRIALLNVLEQRGSRQFGLARPAIKIFLAQFGFRDSTDEQIGDELQYLADKKLVELVGKTISPENRAWRINAEGRDFLAFSP